MRALAPWLVQRNEQGMVVPELSYEMAGIRTVLLLPYDRYRAGSLLRYLVGDRPEQ